MGAELHLGISAPQLKRMNDMIDELERENDAIGLTRVRHAINERLVEIRLYLRDGHTKNMNRPRPHLPPNWKDYK